MQRHGGAYSSVLLRSNRLRDRGATAVMGALSKTLVHLDLSGNALGTGAASALRSWLEQCSASLQCLALNDTGLGDAGLATIAKPLGSCRQLEALDLGAAKLTGDSGQVLAELLESASHLTRLNLGWNGIRGEGARILLEEIANNATLQVLDLRFIGLGRDREGVTALARVLQENTTLTHIDVGFNGLEASHAEELSEALREGGNKTLLGLHVDGNSIALNAQGCADPRSMRNSFPCASPHPAVNAFSQVPSCCTLRPSGAGQRARGQPAARRGVNCAGGHPRTGIHHRSSKPALAPRRQRVLAVRVLAGNDSHGSSVVH